jgi:hypothetical protein
MKKWQNLAAPDDPDSYFDVDGVWPTKQGNYETCDFLSGTEYTATSAAPVIFAWTGQTLSSTRELIWDASRIWEYSAGVLTDRTGGVSIAVPSVVAYGDVIIAANTASVATIKSTGGNFSALAGAPNALIAVTQSNAVLLFGTATAANAWAASDVGDYTNWATGEAASGILYQTPGAITAAVAFGSDVIVFKENAIYRMRYVGGLVKWTVELLVNGIGCMSRHALCAGRNGILFLYQTEAVAQKTVNPTYHFYWFDGVSYPRLVNPLTALTPETSNVVVNYDPRADMFSVFAAGSSAPWNRGYFYCPAMDAWGKNLTPITNTQTAIAYPVMGDYAARAVVERSPQPVMWNKESANKLKRYSHGTPIGEIASSCYIETTKVGSAAAKMQFTRCTPLLGRRVDLGTDSAALSVSTFREREDTSAQATTPITESTLRKRFDFNLTDNFARFKVTWAALDVGVDDIAVEAKPAGKD